VVLDMVAGDYVGARTRVPGRRRPLAIIAVQGGTKSEIDAGAGAAQAAHHHRLHAAPASVAYKTELAEALREQVWPLIEAGRVKPVIHQVFPAAQAAQAHALMESSTHVGKIVLTW
jgi:NADPH2:quinone reductase